MFRSLKVIHAYPEGVGGVGGWSDRLTLINDRFAEEAVKFLNSHS